MTTLCFSGAMDAQTRKLVISVVGFAVSAALLILLIPSLFESPGGVRLGIMGALTVMAVTFGFTARHWRRTLPGDGTR